MTAITAVTVQNTKGVDRIRSALAAASSPSRSARSSRDIGVDAAKTGMLASAAIVEAVADAVAETRLPNLVVDPVSVSKHGHRLLDEDAVGRAPASGSCRSRRSSRRTCPRPRRSPGSR